MKLHQMLLLASVITAMPTQAAEKIVVVNAISDYGIGKIIGTVKLSDSDKGLVIDTDLGDLPPGPHGFHIHENPSCEAGTKDGKLTAGLGAGGHYDPHKTAKHEGPEGTGHAGDLPLLAAKTDGSATEVLLAPKLKVSDLVGHSLMVHEGSDNYSDQPKPLGGGGARIACGIIE